MRTFFKFGNLNKPRGFSEKLRITIFDQKQRSVCGNMVSIAVAKSIARKQTTYGNGTSV